MIEVLDYINNIFVCPTTSDKVKPLNMPYLVVNDKIFYEVKEYFKLWYKIDVKIAFLDSTDDSGVVLSLCTKDRLLAKTVMIINLFAHVSVYTNYEDDNPFAESYVKIDIPIKQEMENV